MDAMETSSTDAFIIRPACKDDSKEIMRLIEELGEHIHLSDQIRIGARELESDGFGARPLFQCVVAECKKPDGDRSTELAGYALFCYVYSTFQGRSAHLEDFFVSQKYRCQGLGTKIFKKMVQIILDKGCHRLDFLVLDWNDRAIKFYKRFGAEDLSATEQWHVWRLEKDQLQLLANLSK